jgi:cell division protein FtsB
MLKHSDPEVQFLVEMLEGQRDQAVAQAAALFRTNRELEAQINQLKSGSIDQEKYD